jgi:DNA-binding response OmpR family regulator
MDKKKILFIEDEADLVEMMKIRLEANGYEMFSASDGQEGLEAAQKKLPQLILLDIVLPKRDGLEICRILKNDQKTKSIPIIIISASGGKNLPQRSLEAGADDFIWKPFDANELLGKIVKYI